MISCSRTGERLVPSSRFLISALKSGMLDSCDQADGLHEFPPAIALGGEDLFSRRGEAVVTTAPLAGLLDPATANPTALFKPVEEGIQRSDVEPQQAARTHLDQLADVISMTRLVSDKRQDQEFRAPFLQFAIEDW